MVIRCVLVLVSTRLVHLNMSYIISWFWLQWFEASIAKFIVIPYQYGILYIDDSNTKQEYIQWWTENETEIVKVKNIDSIFPLYLSSLLMWHYIYSMLIGVGSVMIERVFATIFIHDYEKKDRLYIPLLLISFTHCLSIPFSYFMTNNKISFSVAFGLLFLAMIISILKMERFLRLGGLGGSLGQFNTTPQDSNQVDTSETVYISSLALLKMLKHGRAGVPMEVMGLMLGEFVDEYTVNVIDVFAMPQSGTGVSVEAVDPVFQAKMLDMLKQTGRPEMVVGWYHSHPGFGCWLSGVDINTQQSFEALSDRAVAVVVDPIQSVKGKVVIDAFRTINPQTMALNQEPRQTTSNLGHLQKPSIQALIHGLNRHYYSIPIAYRTHDLEQKMLLNLNKLSWMDAINVENYTKCGEKNKEHLKAMLKLAKNYKKALEDEEKMTEEELAIKNVGKQDPKRHIAEEVTKMLNDNIVQSLAGMMATTSLKCFIYLFIR
ncbi:unnamed protein product [Caenorhabditis angaria]|uniref:26S proteasome non-ATPase regulatory subunit 14 n=1 Tax=Caenorhabditis angaria TaxID=860376 RepID=A0A9P1MVB2_9PELO|nr:unnamed protein product [Caenorhabditis angaria]